MCLSYLDYGLGSYVNYHGIDLLTTKVWPFVHISDKRTFYIGHAKLKDPFSRKQGHFGLPVTFLALLRYLYMPVKI